MKWIATIIVLLSAYWYFSQQPRDYPATPTYDPTAGFSDAERAYYEKVFDYTMETVKSGEGYAWESQGGKGSIIPGEAFISKSKANCRPFKETFSISGKDSADQGVACKRDAGDGWCRLKNKDAHTCIMEAPSNIVDEKLRDAQDGVESGKDIMGKVKGWFSR